MNFGVNFILTLYTDFWSSFHPNSIHYDFGLIFMLILCTVMFGVISIATLYSKLLFNFLRNTIHYYFWSSFHPDTIH